MPDYPCPCLHVPCPHTPEPTSADIKGDIENVMNARTEELLAPVVGAVAKVVGDLGCAVIALNGMRALLDRVITLGVFASSDYPAEFRRIADEIVADLYQEWEASRG